MTEYIDKIKFYKRMLQKYDDCADIVWDIEEAPTIDIVTCKECKYADTQPFRMDSREKEARNLFCGRTLKYVDMDWFCADGERK